MPPAPGPTHFLGYQREAARCPVSLADMELTDAATQRLWQAATLPGIPAAGLRLASGIIGDGRCRSGRCAAAAPAL